jgi:predicted enzyme related to lactoylglutathione lyase
MKRGAFTQKRSGLPLIEESPFALVFAANETTIRVQKVSQVSPAGYTSLGWAIEDIEKTMAQLAARGVKFERYDALNQSDKGIWRTPDGSAVAWFKDPDGNTLSLTAQQKVTPRIIVGFDGHA